MPLPGFHGEDSWLAQSAARSLTKFRDRSQEHAIYPFEEGGERGEGVVRRRREQGEDSGRQVEEEEEGRETAANGGRIFGDRSLKRGFLEALLRVVR